MAAIIGDLDGVIDGWGFLFDGGGKGMGFVEGDIVVLCRRCRLSHWTRGGDTEGCEPRLRDDFGGPTGNDFVGSAT